MQGHFRGSNVFKQLVIFILEPLHLLLHLHCPGGSDILNILGIVRDSHHCLNVYWF